MHILVILQDRISNVNIPLYSPQKSDSHTSRLSIHKAVEARQIASLLILFMSQNYSERVE